ncbi:MAG: MlaD family protein [Candidatus Eremiobacteraeota bacterium]|nr:MlaD family protein [Candidatus Eremiobacteraeota bacterium]
MTRQAQVGAFALLAVLLLFGVFYVITDFQTRHTGYRAGIHFQSAAGLHSGALVYFSGVTVGTVDSIVLLPDNTVDVILAVNRDVDIPRESRFLIQAPLTGDPNLIIVPPVPRPREAGTVGPTPAPPAVAVLEHRVLPIEEQPMGTNTATIADLLEQGQGEIRRMDAMLADLAEREPKLLSSLQETLNNANELTMTAKSTMTTMANQLQSSLSQASQNLVALTTTLNDTTQLNSTRITDILTQFDQTSHALNASMVSLQSLATNANLKTNLLQTTQNIADTTKTMADLTKDLRSITGDPQTQAQLKDTIANLDATMQRANSLLGVLGGTSNVYGVDTSATPYPHGSPPASAATPFPTQRNGGLNAREIALKERLNGIARDLIAIQVRISGLSAQNAASGSPIFSSDRGPQTDVNAVVFPRSTMSGLVGVNDIGHYTTVNAAFLTSLNSTVRAGGGILYSRLGLMAQYNAHVFGLEGRLYDPRHPTLDVYGNLNIRRGLQLFAGQRDLNHADRRTVFGVQAQFP